MKRIFQSYSSKQGTLLLDILAYSLFKIIDLFENLSLSPEVILPFIASSLAVKRLHTAMLSIVVFSFFDGGLITSFISYSFSSKSIIKF